MSSSTHRLKHIGIASLSIVLALIFLAAGGTKLTSPDTHADAFARWGYPMWFLYVIGMVEVAGALLILVPAARFYGAVVLGMTMLGAAYTHLRADELQAVPIPLVLMALAGVVAWGSRSPKAG